jgi:hypothetical protein
MTGIPEHQSVDSAGTPAAGGPAPQKGAGAPESFGDMPVETDPHTSGAKAPRGDDGSDRLSIRTSPVIDLTEQKAPPPPPQAPPPPGS